MMRLRKAGLESDLLIWPKPRKAVPHEFVLDAVAEASPQTRHMFGCLAVYVGDKIVFALRDKAGNTADNGVWLATTEEHHASLRREFPNMRSIEVFGKPVTGWQVIPADAEDFEEAALHACELVVAGDIRIGKAPGAKKMKPSKSGKIAGKKSAVAKDMDEYLAEVPEPARSTLEKMRAMIRPLMPEGTVEGISYGIPAFIHGKPLLGFAAFKDHCSFFPWSGYVVEELAKDLKAYETSKGTIRFAVDRPLPAALVKKLVKARLADQERKKKARGN